MNVFGARRFGLGQIALSILLCTGGITFAQDEEPPPASGQEKKLPPVDLVFKSLDLKYSSEGLVGGAVGTKSGSEGVAGGAVDLKSQVVDLVAKGIDVKESADEIKIRSARRHFVRFRQGGYSARRGTDAHRHRQTHSKQGERESGHRWPHGLERLGQLQRKVVRSARGVGEDLVWKARCEHEQHANARLGREETGCAKHTPGRIRRSGRSTEKSPRRDYHQKIERSRGPECAAEMMLDQPRSSPWLRRARIFFRELGWLIGQIAMYLFRALRSLIGWIRVRWFKRSASVESERRHERSIAWRALSPLRRAVVRAAVLLLCAVAILFAARRAERQVSNLRRGSSASGGTRCS